MSIFEPIPREYRPDDDTYEFESASWEDDVAPPRESFDPRSIWIAGLVLSGIVATGLVVTSLAEPEPRTRPAVASRVDPGAAAVEQTEVQQPIQPAEPVDEAASDDDGADSDGVDSDARESEDSAGHAKGNDRPDKPGKGHGHGRG